jgi:hypothetical protein
MDRKAIERIISSERLEPYLRHHHNDFDKAVEHYKANIEISESFYPMLSILEVGLRNSIDYQLTRKFNDENWFENNDFIKIVSSYQIDSISEARKNIHREKKVVTSGKVIAELSFGFWTSLFDSRFEMTLWKNLRLAFPNCPKKIRKRKTMSSKFNGIRKLRNRIFHHEPITWDLGVVHNYEKEIIEGIDWLNRGLVEWSDELIHIDKVIEKRKELIK